MIQSGVCKNLETGADGPALWVVCAIDEARDAGLDDGSGTHAAGLQRDVESCVCHAVIAEEASSFPDHDDFGMGRGVAGANRAVAGAGENFAVVNDQGANRDFAFGGCGASFLDGELHKRNVGVHV